MNVAYFDKSKQNVYYHIAGKEDLQCFVDQNNHSTYLCYFGKWAIVAPGTNSTPIVYDIIDQFYCSNNDSYTDSCTSSLLYIIYMSIVNVIYG